MFVDEDDWRSLRRFQKEIVRCYAAGLNSTRAVLVGRSAARIGGLWVLPTDDELVELALPNGRPSARSRWFEGHEYRYMRIPEEDLVEVGGVRYTDSIRTAIDVARFHGFRHGLVAFDSVLEGHNRQTARAIWKRINRELKRMAGTANVGDARLAHLHATHNSESPYESFVRAVLIELGIRFEIQVVVGPYRVDILVDGWLVIEVDGYVKFEDKPHDAVLKQMERENWLRSHHFEVMRLFTSQVLDPAAWIVDLERLLATAGQRVPVTISTSAWQPAGPGRHTFAA